MFALSLKLIALHFLNHLQVPNGRTLASLRSNRSLKKQSDCACSICKNIRITNTDRDAGSIRNEPSNVRSLTMVGYHRCRNRQEKPKPRRIVSEMKGTTRLQRWIFRNRACCKRPIRRREIVPMSSVKRIRI